MNQEWQNAFIGALASLRVTGPKSLMPRVELAAEGTGLDVSVAALLQHLSSVGPNDAVKKALSVQLAQWDVAEESEEWTQGEAKRSEARRSAIYRGLGLPVDCHPEFDIWFPISTRSHVVIAEDFEPWYTRELQSGLGFYWPSYRDYLMAKPGWAAASVAELDSATTDIVQRLSDPSRPDIYQSKGLVVGYVQSGKTANIAGVLAKAVDAGYRLLIVLTGTIDLLREQTQRRLDMELVGVENIRTVAEELESGLNLEFDYSDDPDWEQFVRHGARPSTLHQPDIVRLTNHRFREKSGDYQSLRAGITALEIQKLDQSLPLYDRTNLDRASARLAIVKKNARVLKRLVGDLRRIPSNLAEIPAIIIDDESDLASVNTSNPSSWQRDQPRRTAINSLISEMLTLLPRAQYIGYTATPFANVFVDPSDSADIFPKDFLIALSRPTGYMGASDFHDLDPELDDEGRTVRSEGELAHVRDLLADKDDDEGRRRELGVALSMFVLTGAIKLWRQSQGLATYRHHTMLAHESVRRADHMRLAEDVRTVWRTLGFTSPSGLMKLRNLYENDIVLRSIPYEEAQLPGIFDDLRGHIGEAIARITATGDPVLVVNSDKDIASGGVDFDKRPVWRVLVGGAKLSRGFTVEGLTVSYYRRKTGQADSLMQMGRWFGFRTGYRDLVRLYIDRRVRAGKRVRAYDLYEAFGASVRAEELFRNELLRYSTLVDGKPQVRPIEIPPLVTQHLPWLRPTASNKMYNAELEVRRFDELEPVAYPIRRADIEANYDTMLPLLLGASTKVCFATPEAFGNSTFRARVGSLPHELVLGVVSRLKWLYPGYFEPDIAHLSDLSDEIDDWAVIVPQLRSNGVHQLPGGARISVSKRTRSVRGDGNLFQNISDPKHRFAAKRIAGVRIDEAYLDSEAESWTAARRGALIIYPITEKLIDEAESPVELSRQDCIMAMRLVSPGASINRTVPFVGFRVQVEEQANDPIVDDPRSQEI